MFASRPVRRVAVLGAGLLIALTACSSSGSTSSSEPAAVAPADAGANRGDAAADKALTAEGAPAAPPAPGSNQGGGGGSTGNAPAPVDERSLIYTGSILIEVKDVPAAADRIKTYVAGLGGLITGDNRSIDADRSQATLVLRVPADQFNSVLDSLPGRVDGEEETRQVQATDVTDQLVDLDVRVATQEASVSRVRDLLSRAQTLGEIVSLESELTRRQADLDSLKQRREKLKGLVALATITVNLHGPAAKVEPPRDDTGFLAGLREGWRGFLASVKVVLTVAGWLLPWAIVIGAPVWALLWLRRRRRRTAPLLPSGPPRSSGPAAAPSAPPSSSLPTAPPPSDAPPAPPATK